MNPILSNNFIKQMNLYANKFSYLTVANFHFIISFYQKWISYSFINYWFFSFKTILQYLTVAKFYCRWSTVFSHCLFPEKYIFIICTTKYLMSLHAFWDMHLFKDAVSCFFLRKWLTIKKYVIPGLFGNHWNVWTYFSNLEKK